MRVLLIILVLGFFALLAWAAGAGDAAAAMAFLGGAPWGIVTITDFYLGILVFAVLVYSLERSWPVTLAWALPAIVLGNPVAVAYLIWRQPWLRSKPWASQPAAASTPGAG